MNNITDIIYDKLEDSDSDTLDTFEPFNGQAVASNHELFTLFQEYATAMDINIHREVLVFRETLKPKALVERITELFGKQRRYYTVTVNNATKMFKICPEVVFFNQDSAGNCLPITGEGLDVVTDTIKGMEAVTPKKILTALRSKGEVTGIFSKDPVKFGIRVTKVERIFNPTSLEQKVNSTLPTNVIVYPYIEDCAGDRLTLQGKSAFLAIRQVLELRCLSADYEELQEEHTDYMKRAMLIVLFSEYPSLGGLFAFDFGQTPNNASLTVDGVTSIVKYLPKSPIKDTLNEKGQNFGYKIVGEHHCNDNSDLSVELIHFMGAFGPNTITIEAAQSLIMEIAESMTETQAMAALAAIKDVGQKDDERMTQIKDAIKLAHRINLPVLEKLYTSLIGRLRVTLAEEFSDGNGE